MLFKGSFLIGLLASLRIDNWITGIQKQITGGAASRQKKGGGRRPLKQITACVAGATTPRTVQFFISGAESDSLVTTHSQDVSRCVRRRYWKSWGALPDANLEVRTTYTWDLTQNTNGAPNSAQKQLGRQDIGWLLGYLINHWRNYTKWIRESN